MGMTHRRPHGLRVGLLLAVGLLVASCGSEVEPGDEVADATPDDRADLDEDAEEPDMAGDDDTDWQAGAGAEWEEVLAEAREEGAVTVAGFPFLADPMTEAFERDTGITLQWLGATGAELSARLAQEAESGNVTVDLHLGVGSDPWTLYPQGHLQDLRPQLLLPGVTEGANWRDGEIRFMDPDGAYFIQPTEWVHGWAVVNTDTVDPDELQEWEDLLDPRWRGMIASSDPTVPGPGQGAANFLQVEFGLDFVTDLFVQQEIEYTQDPNQLAEWAARGTYPIALGVIPPNLERFREEGFSLEPVLPGYLTGGFSPIKQLEGVPNPNAATVFLNWYLSEPGQTVYSNVVLEQSLRTDVIAEQVPEYVDPVEYPALDFDGYEWDYYVDQRAGLLEVLVDTLEGGR